MLAWWSSGWCLGLSRTEARSSASHGQWEYLKAIIILCEIFHTCFIWHDKKFTNLCDGQLFRVLIESVLVKLIKISPPLQE
jgi:hypothetical protein